jgi:hypothetical protein
MSHENTTPALHIANTRLAFLQRLCVAKNTPGGSCGLLTGWRSVVRLEERAQDDTRASGAPVVAADDPRMRGRRKRRAERCTHVATGVHLIETTAAHPPLPQLLLRNWAEHLQSLSLEPKDVVGWFSMRCNRWVCCRAVEGTEATRGAANLAGLVGRVRSLADVLLLPACVPAHLVGVVLWWRSPGPTSRSL